MSHTKTISFINMKGGVGKTTLAVNISYALAKFHNKSVLLIDLDPQFNTTQYILGTKRYLEHINNKKPIVMDIFIGKPSTNPSIVKGTQPSYPPKPTLNNLTINVYNTKGNLDLIPSTLDMIELDTSQRGTERKLKKFIEKTKNYDYIIIDSPPTIGFCTISALLASDGILIPIKPDYLSTIGLPLLEKYIEEERDYFDKEIEELGIIFTMVDRRSNLLSEIKDTISKEHRYIFSNYLSNSVHVARAVAQQKPLFDFKNSKKQGEEIKVITNELINRVESIW